MTAAPCTTIVIPGDDPPQIAGSPRLDRLREYGEVVLYEDRPETVEEQLRRAGDADVIINSRGAVKWPGEILQQLPKLKMMTVCGIIFSSGNCRSTLPGHLTAPRELMMTSAWRARRIFSSSVSGRSSYSTT